MKIVKPLGLSIPVLAALVLTVSAQQPGTGTNQPMPAMHCMQGMGMQSSQNSMAGPMKHDHENMMSLRQSAGLLRQDLANARQSNDPAQMRNALDEADKWISSVSDNMNSCANMMGMKGEGTDGSKGSNSMGSQQKQDKP